MFLTKMVRDFIDSIKNSNQHQNHQKTQHQPQTNQTRSGNSGCNTKSNKKSTKNKKSLTKSDSLNNNNNNSNNNSKNLEKEHLSSDPSTSKVLENCKSKSSKAVTKAASQTKVKSGSWKRSEKSLTPYNATLPSKKKPKALRKRSPTWLQFQNSSYKSQNFNTPAITNGQTSNCRPGTLYSDVLFGAGCSNFVKIKNITPRRTNCAPSQKKLTKALQKFNAKEHETLDDAIRLSFPSLENLNNKMPSSKFTNSTVKSKTVKTTASLETISNQESSLTTDTTNTTPSTAPSSPNKHHYDHQHHTTGDEDVIILTELNDSPSLSNITASYGHYLEQHCLCLVNGKTEAAAAASSCQDKRLIVSSICDIPNWNFMDFTYCSDVFPKFLGQFDDENYLNAERMACLGLKLALGNNPLPNKYKFQ